jgi:hypothetical protein
MYFVQSNECFKAYAKMNGLELSRYPEKEPWFEAVNGLLVNKYANATL